MAQFLDPKNDLTFKRIFGEHEHLCISLINSMLPLEKPVVEIEYQTGELIPELPGLRNSIVDVRCILDAYDKWKIDDMTERSALNEAKRAGMIEGKIEGEIEGEIKGKIKVAKNLLKKGLSIEDVIDATGLTKQQIH